MAESVTTGLWNSSKRARQDSRRSAAVLAYGIDGLPSETEDVTPEQSARLDGAATAMMAAGHWPPGSQLADVRNNIRRQVGLLRKTAAKNAASTTP